MHKRKYMRLQFVLPGTQEDLKNKVQLEVLRRVPGFQRRADHINFSCAKALKKTKCESIEMTIRKLRLLFAGAIVPQNKGRLFNRVMFTQIACGKNPGPGGPPNYWLRTLRDDLAVFRSTEGCTEDSPRQVGDETVLWVHVANKAGKVVPGDPRSSRMVHGQVADISSKKELGAPHRPDAWRPKPKGGGGVGKPRMEKARRSRQTG